MGTEVDFQLLFEASPEVLLVLKPDAPRYTMVAATRARFEVTHTHHDSLGRGLFEVFPDNPDDPAASGTSNLRASLGRVLATRRPDTMAVQKYDIRGPDGNFEARYWSPRNIPVLSTSGEIRYILHRVEDVTELVRASETGDALRGRTREMELEVLRRSGELSAALVELRQANAKLAELDIAKTELFRSMSHELERRVEERTAELLRATQELEGEVRAREDAQRRLQSQVERLHLLQQITRAIGERHDLASIFQVVIRALEDQLPVDFGCLCMYDPIGRQLAVDRVGLGGAELGLTEATRIGIDDSGLGRCIDGQLVYEPDIRRVPLPFPRRLAAAGLCALVAAPLAIDAEVIGVLIVARHAPESFSSGECEFLRQLCEHVALAVHQAQLHTSLQHAYDELRETQQAVLQQERLRALGQMASGIAHDINNAISPVMLYTESLLEQEPGLSAHARGCLETIQRAIDDVAKTVARMREFYRSREEQATLVSVDINRIVEQVIDLTRVRWSDMAHQRGAVVDVATDLAPALPAIAGAENELREALTNLVFNAIDAMPAGGTLTLRTLASGPDGVDLEVRDTGIGMDEEARRRCLEPFFTTKGERGTGLGLAMVYGTVRRHNAHLDIESEVGRGTCMRLRFPVPSTAPARPVQSLHPRVTRGLRLLLVDDDPVLIRSMNDILEIDGHSMTLTHGGQAGIDAFHAALGRGEPFDLVITDLGMPHVDGRKVAAAIKGATPATPVILLTGWGERMIAEGDMPPHVDKVLAKPPRLLALRQALAELASPQEACEALAN